MKFDGGEQAKYLTRVRVEVDGQFGRENGAGSPKRLGVTPEDSAVVAISVRAATRVCVEIARRTEASVGDSQWWAEPPPLGPISFRCRSRFSSAVEPPQFRRYHLAHRLPGIPRNPEQTEVASKRRPMTE